MKTGLITIAYIAASALMAGFLSSCSSPILNPISSSSISTPSNVFDVYLASLGTPADGFDFPVGSADGIGVYVDRSTGGQHKGWFVATKFGEHYSLGIHPAEDWNGAGGGDTDYGQPVHSVASGVVVEAQDFGQPWGNVVVIDHTFYQNFEKKTIRSLYAHLSEIHVGSGDMVTRRQEIGGIGKDPNKTFSAHLHLELRWDTDLPTTFWPSSNGKDGKWVSEHYAEPTEFIKNHRKLFVPQKEKTLVLVDQNSYKMRLYREGLLDGEFDISLGQGKGQKTLVGDNKTPKGMYFVTNKHQGEFEGEYGKYYGGYWIKVNYPNRYDAERGLADGVITSDQAKLISSNWSSRRLTSQETKLGGGIGFHGWIREWENEGPRHLSWGCVVMHIRDIGQVFDRIPEESMVVIF